MERPDILVMEDKVPVYTSKFQKPVFISMDILRLIQCGNSPDLNIINAMVRLEIMDMCKRLDYFYQEKTYLCTAVHGGSYRSLRQVSDSVSKHVALAK